MNSDWTQNETFWSWSNLNQLNFYSLQLCYCEVVLVDHFFLTVMLMPFIAKNRSWKLHGNLMLVSSRVQFSWAQIRSVFVSIMRHTKSLDTVKRERKEQDRWKHTIQMVTTVSSTATPILLFLSISFTPQSTLLHVLI